jgi:phosphoribosylformimino-5-aminoimidazole carboxamide ribotide isomerase
MRSEEAIGRALDAGVSRVVIGTRASESIDFVAQMVAKFGSERIVVGIDAKDGIVSVKGWTELSNLKAIDLAKQVEAAGAGTIVYTDIATDGMMQGPNYAELQNLLNTVRCNVIASGGVSTPEDVRKLRQIPGLYGAIIGKALYEGAIKLEELE